MDIKGMLITFKSQRLCASAVKKYFIFLFIIFSTSSILSQNKIQYNPDDIKWFDAPAPFPLGTMMAILEGNPKNEGIFTMRVIFTPYFKIPAHTHPKDERVTVLSGSIYVGFGDKLDTTNAVKFSQGSYYVNFAGTHHYVFTQSEGVTFQITGLGPWQIDYLEDKK